MRRPIITDGEFAQFQRFIYEAAGISMSAAKKSLVSGRLAKRVEHYGLGSYGDYFRLLQERKDAGEMQTAIDLLTTNETYFFREEKHFSFLRERAAASLSRGQPFRVWSAACSSGEEAYSMAMVLSDCLDTRVAWDILGTDISTRVLQKARSGHYPDERTRHIPPDYLKRYCMKGVGPQQGTVLVRKALRDRVNFRQLNLNAPLPAIGSFDVVFLRNVMIYFDGRTKTEVVERISNLIKPGGYLCIGHSETLNDISDAVISIKPSIYRKP